VQAQARPDGKALDRAANAHRLQCPLLVHHGDADRAVKLDEARRMVEALKKSGQPVEFHIYSAADHAYHDDSHPNHHPEAAALSWERTLEFLARYLSAPTRRAA
jgi:carboxymethylenebutenolidase